MRKILGRVLLTLLILVGVILALGPTESPGVLPLAPLPPSDTPSDAVESLLAAEARIPGIIPGAEKEVIWAGEKGVRTPLSIVYIHGFSATKEETRPFPDALAEELGANLFYTRLAGHGRSSEDLGRARAHHWMLDMAEALEVGRAIGDQVLVVGSSMGGALAALSATEPSGREDVAGYVLLSPLFGVRMPFASWLNRPFARWYLPVLLGPERSWIGKNPEHEKWWTSSYPVEVLASMASIAETALYTDYAGAKRPALFLFAEGDEIADPDRTREVASRWGGRADLLPLEPGPEDDPQKHVLAGRILSPALDPVVTQAVIDWTIANGISAGPPPGDLEDEAEEAPPAPDGTPAAQPPATTAPSND